MPATLAVDLNEGSLHEIAVADAFETTSGFVVELNNHGEAVHVHLHLDDELSRVARLDETNHFVSGGGRRRVAVDARDVDEAVAGKLKVVTGYGAESAYVDVTVEPEQETEETVDVDERLSKPPQRESSGGGPGIAARLASGSVRGVAAVAVVAVLAVALAAAVALTVSDPAVFLGVGVVIGAALAAVVFALR